MSYTDYLDYWMKEHCEINLKYHTIQAYKNIIKNHVKPRIGSYMLSQITTSTLQEFVNNIYVEKGFSKNFLKNILKVLKTSFSYATDVVGFVKENPALQEKNRIEYGDSYMKHYAKEVTNQYTNKPETKIINAYAELDVALPEVNLVLVKKNGAFEGTANQKISDENCVLFLWVTLKLIKYYKRLKHIKIMKKLKIQQNLK